MIFNNNASKIITNFPIELFEKKQGTKGWPFSDKLAMKLFYSNHYEPYSSLQEFFISNLFEKSDDQSVEEEKGFGRTSPQVGCWDSLSELFFFIENFVLYYSEPSENSPSIWYRFKYISYDTIVCAAIRYYLNDYLDNRLPDSTGYAIWIHVLDYFLYTNFSLKKLFEQERFMGNYNQEIICGFYAGFRDLEKKTR